MVECEHSDDKDTCPVCIRAAKKPLVILDHATIGKATPVFRQGPFSQSPHVVIAQYDDTCLSCDEEIFKGDEIVWDEFWIHKECA